MPKILVADDNSNIQEMVSLALKDRGIDVVAVGNGEAAVRRISDVRPDLVLADLFMPGGNGYEVCQYVKMDSELSHIPVILLVGAFDPLDEQEAQRVGADGVLKKPFIPPDPLISMVNSALQRAGVAPGSMAGKAPEPEAPRAADMLMPINAALPTVTATPLSARSFSGAARMDQGFVEGAPAARVGASIQIKGEVTGTEDLQIDGIVDGPITLQGYELTVGSTAQLNSEIHAGNVVAYGKVVGNIHSRGRVDIKKDGSIIGDIDSARISIEDGAHFKGRVASWVSA
jgi:CheY-like chemotaxis protein/cytoskeletal protein CcmA (bactofilin family)